MLQQSTREEEQWKGWWWHNRVICWLRYKGKRAKMKNETHVKVPAPRYRECKAASAAVRNTNGRKAKCSR